MAADVGKIFVACRWHTSKHSHNEDRLEIGIISTSEKLVKDFISKYNSQTMSSNKYRVGLYELVEIEDGEHWPNL